MKKILHYIHEFLSTPDFNGVVVNGIWYRPLPKISDKEYFEMRARMNQNHE